MFHKKVTKSRLMTLWNKFNEDMKVDLASRWLKKDKSMLWELDLNFENLEPVLIGALERLHETKDATILQSAIQEFHSLVYHISSHSDWYEHLKDDVKIIMDDFNRYVKLVDRRKALKKIGVGAVATAFAPTKLLAGNKYSQKVLLIVDENESVVESGKTSKKQLEKIIVAAQKANSVGMRVIATYVNKEGSVAKELLKYKTDRWKIMYKKYLSCFEDTDLDMYLKLNYVSEIIIAGQDMRFCVMATFEDAVKLGYKVSTSWDLIHGLECKTPQLADKKEAHQFETQTLRDEDRFTWEYFKDFQGNIVKLKRDNENSSTIQIVKRWPSILTSEGYKAKLKDVGVVLYNSFREIPFD